jgi:hypothetical protein
MNTTSPRLPHATLHLLLTLAGLAGIAGLFLPFTANTSPVDALRDDLWGVWRLAVPFFLAPFALAAGVRWIIAGPLSGPERLVAYVVSAASACLTLYFVGDGLKDQGWPSNVRDWLVVLVPVVVLLSGAYVLVPKLGFGRSSGFNPVLAIQVAYLANALLCLIGFFGEWQVGAYCALVPALAYLVQIVLISVQPGAPAAAGTGGG